MIDLEKYDRLKKKADKAKEDIARAEGALEQQLKKLKEEFDCETVEQAETLLVTLKKEEAAAESAYNEKMVEFEKKWGDLL